LRTGETSQLLLSSHPNRYAKSTPIEALARHLGDCCAVLCTDEQLLQNVFVYARLLYPYGESSASELQKVMTKTAECWRNMLVDGATHFLAGSSQLVAKLLDQKAALNAELHQLQVCAFTNPEFKQSRHEFVQQLQTGLVESPYYLDVVLRRLLLRVFAEGWLPSAHLATVFTL
jgi:hypothetical protein